MSDAINLLDTLALAGDAPITVTLGTGGAELTVRRDYSGDEIAEIIALQSQGSMPDTLQEQIDRLLEIMSADETQNEFFNTALMSLPVVVVHRVTENLQVEAGIRTPEGSFTAGAPR